MKAEKTFQKNIERWARTNPKEATMLPYVDCAGVVFTQTGKGEPSLSKHVGGKVLCFHSPEGAAEEAEEWFQSLTLSKKQVLYVYGVGLGYYYGAAKKWLKKNKKHFLVFLEDDMAVIHRLMETEAAGALLADPQVRLLYFSNLKEKQEALEAFYWNVAMADPETSALKLYAETKADVLSEVSHKMAYDHAAKNALVDEYLRFGGPYFLNFYQNMLELPRSYLGNGLFGKFTGIPAIICGAGPSLEKNIHLLKDCFDKALIFAGGSAMNVLNEAGLQPHFGAGIDPNPAQHFRMSSATAFEVPYFYRNRMYPAAFQLIHGPRLYITGGGGYDVAQFFEERLHIQSPEWIDEGHNVVNFCVDVARAMGCNPILFAGVDLAFTNKKAYASGVALDANFDKETIAAFQEMEKEGLVEKDIFGAPVFTLWKWVAEAQWIGDYAKEHPEVLLVNCTEGGLGFPGVANLAFSEGVKRHLTASYDLAGLVHAEVQNNAMPGITREKVEASMRELQDSLRRSVDHFDLLMAEARRQEEEIKKDPAASPQQSGRAALAETDLAEEPAYQYVVAIFNEVYSRILSGELQEIRLSTRKQQESKKNLKKIAVNLKRLEFLKKVALVNIELIDYAFNERKKREMER